MKYKAKYLILASVNVLGAIILAINILIIVAQLFFNNSIGEKVNNIIKNTKDNIKNEVLSAVNATDLYNETSNEDVDINGNNIVLICLFIVTILIAFGYIIKGIMYILSERPNYLANKGVQMCSKVNLLV